MTIYCVAKLVIYILKGLMLLNSQFNCLTHIFSISIPKCNFILNV